MEVGRRGDSALIWPSKVATYVSLTMLRQRCKIRERQQQAWGFDVERFVIVAGGGAAQEIRA